MAKKTIKRIPYGLADYRRLQQDNSYYVDKTRFIPLLEVLHYPVVGLVALAIILTTLIARVPLPGRVPGALGALLVGSLIYYIMQSAGILGEVPAPELQAAEALLPTGWLSVFTFEWLGALKEAFGSVKLTKPKASRGESREVFVVARDFRG